MPACFSVLSSDSAGFPAFQDRKYPCRSIPLTLGPCVTHNPPIHSSRYFWSAGAATPLSFFAGLTSLLPVISYAGRDANCLPRDEGMVMLDAVSIRETGVERESGVAAPALQKYRLLCAFFLFLGSNR